MTSKRTILIIMDGWGLGKVKSSDAIQNAKTPFVSSLYQKYPNSTLITCGEAVGLPDGQMGNSEVGHLNLGAGRIVYQELQRINVAVRDGEFQKNQHLLAALNYAKENKKPLHANKLQNQQRPLYAAQMLLKKQENPDLQHSKQINRKIQMQNL